MSSPPLFPLGFLKQVVPVVRIIGRKRSGAVPLKSIRQSNTPVFV